MTKAAALAAAQGPAPGSVAGASGPRPQVPSLYRFSWRTLPREVKLMAIVLAVVLLLGLGWVFMVPYRPKPIVPLLGWSEPTSGRKPSPAPTSSPRGSGQPKPQKKGWRPW